MQSIVTSFAQNDSGLFETNLRDERYLPFENSGVISEWQLKLPANPGNGEPCQFDYNTISDVILHLRYTAREGGELLRKGAVENLKTMIDEAQAAGSVRLFSVRHEFPTEWAKFKNPRSIDILTLEIQEEHFPYWSKDRLGVIKKLDIFRLDKNNITEVSFEADSRVEKFINKPDGTKTSDGGEKLLTELPNVSLKLNAPEKFTLEFNFHIKDKSIEDIWLALTWGK